MGSDIILIFCHVEMLVNLVLGKVNVASLTVWDKISDSFFFKSKTNIYGKEIARLVKFKYAIEIQVEILFTNDHQLIQLKYKLLMK